MGNVLIQIDFNAKSTSTSRSEKCVDSNRLSMQNRLLLVEVKNALIQIDFDAKSTSTSRSDKCVDHTYSQGSSNI